MAKADIVIVPAWNSPETIAPASLSDALRKAHARGAQVVGLCLGAFVLGDAGLLDGRRATTHWACRDLFAKRFPLAHFLRDVLYVDDGNVMTSAGTVALIAERFPKLNRCVTGYDLVHLCDEAGRFNLSSVLCGAEGSLAFVTEARIKLTPIPRCTAVLAIRYGSFDAALRDAGALMKLQAASSETVDARVLALARQDAVWLTVKDYFPDDPEGPAQGVNIVEFLGDDEADLAGKLARVEADLATNMAAAGRRGYTVAHGEAAATAIWSMRKKSVGLLGNMQGEARPMPFVEDTGAPRRVWSAAARAPMPINCAGAWLGPYEVHSDLSIPRRANRARGTNGPMGCRRHRGGADRTVGLAQGNESKAVRGVVPGISPAEALRPLCLSWYFDQRHTADRRFQ